MSCLQTTVGSTSPTKAQLFGLSVDSRLEAPGESPWSRKKVMKSLLVVRAGLFRNAVNTVDTVSLWTVDLVLFPPISTSSMKSQIEISKSHLSKDFLPSSETRDFLISSHYRHTA